MQTFKLFVSSPGDAMVERRRVENVASRLNGEFAGVARLETVRWETEFYQAYSTFQAQIPRSTDCDLVIGILRWRLGTELPPDFGEKLPGNQPFPSGTAYEILTAIEKRQKGAKLPDIYVFRFAGSSPSVTVDDPNRERIERDWQALKGFLQEWFLTERGHFKAAFNPYVSEDDFEAQLEKLLRKWVADKVAGGRVVRWPIEVKGSPFRGLAAFGAKHAPVLFGRGEDTSRALERWREAGIRGSPYLLVVGASGSGKSSLVRAGVIPRLTTPGVIEEVDAWRVAAMRPGDSPAGPIAALAAALMQDEPSLPKDEEGRGPALPEIAQGDSKTPAELAAVLRHADSAAAVKPVINALSRVGALEHERERYGREVRCNLVLLIDQFEELFAASVNEAERAAFVALMNAMVATGRIWLVATLRADFYARMVEQAALKELKELGATYDLAAPGPVELAEIVRGPSEAAGLVFETDASTGERLDSRLLSDAERPDMLPLVQLALSRLFDGRETRGGEVRLPLKVYESLGGLKGIVNEAGETALATLGEAEKARLPRLLRQLAVPVHEHDGLGKGTLTIRAATLGEAAPDASARKLLDALVIARLLTVSGTKADAQVRLAHQRVLQDWARARTIVAESADFYRIRDDVEESRRRWETGKRRHELLLQRGLPLAEAESIVGKYSDEIAPEVSAYVQASRKRANRMQMIAWGAAAVFGLVAIAAGIETWFAFRARDQAVHALGATMLMADNLVFQMGQDVRLRGLPSDLLNRMFDRAIQGYNQVVAINPQNALAYNGRGAAYLAKRDFDHAMSDLDRAIALDPKLAAAYSNRGNAYFDKHDFDRAIADYTQAIALNPKLAIPYNNRGNAYRSKGELDRAIADYTQAIVLDPKYAYAYYNRGNTYSDKHDLDHAIADYTQAIALSLNFAMVYFNRGNAYQEKSEFDRAIADYTQAIALDPKSAMTYYNRGNVYRGNNDLDHAIADYTQAIALDPKYAAAYINRGLTYLMEDDPDRAIADYNQAIALYPNFAMAYSNRGSAYLGKGDLDHAIADLNRAIALDPKYALAYYNRGNAYRDKADFDRAMADFDQAIALAPKSAVAYLGRALAELYNGLLSKALADLNQSSELDPAYPLAAIWLDIADKRNHLPSRLAEAVNHVDMTKWPAPVIRLYLGQSTPADVLAAAENAEPNLRKQQVCQANFYIGEKSLLQGNKPDATPLFRRAAADCPKNADEWWAAGVELKALGSN